MKYLFFAFTTAGFLIACSPTTTEIIETTETEKEVTSTTPTMPKSDIADGKVVFLKNCIGCHYGRSTDDVPGLIDQYTKEEWARILPRMIQNAALDDEKSRQVSTYIYWELEN